ncbi:MAG: PVC-type heme-binding CxxCH protein, partial [Planctomycetota bacterium]
MPPIPFMARVLFMAGGLVLATGLGLAGPIHDAEFTASFSGTLEPDQPTQRCEESKPIPETRGVRLVSDGPPSKTGGHQRRQIFDVPQTTASHDDLPDFEYIDVGPQIPNYTPSRKWGTQGAPKTLMQKPLAPTESIQHFVTPVGMKVRLFADERDFESKPIAMTWDERGRLWICETLDYPNALGKDRDRIRICEDTDGDAVADKFTVFAEGLSIPTAIVIVRGGAVVQNGTNTIYLKDLDGDDVADQKTALITGWSLGDTHGGVSNFRYGLDNWIWAMQGYNDSTPRFEGKAHAGKEPQTFRQGFWRFKLSQTDPPTVTDLEFVRSSNNNTWGLGISEEGLIFGSTANGNPSMFVPIPNRYFERVRGWSPSTLGGIADTPEFAPITANVRQVDHHGRYTAAAGHAIYTARAFPKQWWNRTAFVCGPTGHLVGTFVIRPEGANFASTSPLNLLASDDEWSAPIMAEVGPDGAVWVIDWYNYIVQHNPTPNGFETGKGRAYESDLRDQRHGRIYRVVPEDLGKLHPYASLEHAANVDLVATLKHPSMQWRLHAQRLLIERNASGDRSVIDDLVALATDPEVDSIGTNVGAIHALHTLAAFETPASASPDGAEIEKATGTVPTSHSEDRTDPHVIRATSSALTHSSAGVRQNALAVLPNTDAGLSVLLQNHALFSDPSDQVRLQAVLKLADMPLSTDAGRLVSLLASRESDSIMIDALVAAAAAHAMPFLDAVSAQAKNNIILKTDDLDGLVDVTTRVAEHVARGRPDAMDLEQIVAGLIRDADKPDESNRSAEQSSRIIVSLLDGMTQGLPGSSLAVKNASLDGALLR